MNRGEKTGPTGPRMKEGKAVASRNALKHGLLSRLPLLPDEDEEVFEGLRNRLHEALRPEGELELLLVERVGATAWRLRRLERIEGGILAWHYYEEVQDRLRARVRSHEKTLLDQISAHETIITDAKARDGALEELSRVHTISRRREDVLVGRAFIRDGTEMDALAKLARYEAGLERILYRTLGELRCIQDARHAVPAEVVKEGAGTDAESLPTGDETAEAVPT